MGVDARHHDFAVGANVLEGRDAVINIERLGIDLPFAEAYARVA